MANPGRVRRQVIGVADPAFAERMLRTLRTHGSVSAWVVHGNGLDELTTTGTSSVLALSEGEVSVADGDCTVECWLHGSRFDLRTGKPIGLPATEPVATFAVEVRGGDVYVDTTTTLNGVTPQ